MFKNPFATWRRRPFPANLLALKHCRISYSQYGEDLFLTHLLGYERTNGVYVDIGCFHPIRFSNTYIFYQRGWRGCCIDANPEWRSDWEKHRPHDRFVAAAIAPQPSTMWYVKDRLYPAMNRLVEAGPDIAPPASDDRFTSVEVQAAPLSQILRTSGVRKEIDLLSIDCEGMDLAILETLDFHEFQPKVLCVEDHDRSVPSATQAFLTAKGYELRATIGISKIFERVMEAAPGATG